VKKGFPKKSETARRFSEHRATVKRYCDQLDERGTLEPRKAPGKRPKCTSALFVPSGFPVVALIVTCRFDLVDRRARKRQAGQVTRAHKLGVRV
jgi:hypothetical protein